MSYQVLARKYRPKSFATLVGQEHVVRALTHALEQQRLHHAYLFTGTRGVGKTTLSRILAKSFNCERGISANPCGVCEACTAIDAGRFVDYIEMDAASNRGVDEMAALLEQAIYAPSNARFKVYMIDEVHMLTNHAFNAMLKTLEEPPPHIKFILATTDPQKIPVTVLSRCLQFNLKQMPPGHIIGHLGDILGQEQIEFDPLALRLLAQGAHGSMRDALSLTDQAIAYAAGKVTLEAVQGMLGALDQSYLIRLLDALAQQDGAAMLAVADEMAARSLSYKAALQDLGSVLHQIAIAQLVPDALAADLPEREHVLRLAQLFGKEEIQLYYQIVVHGKNELGLAPDEYAGFGMCLLRMLAFRPVEGGSADVAAPRRAAPAGGAGKSFPAATPAAPAAAAAAAVTSAAVRAPAAPAAATPAAPVAASMPAPAPAASVPSATSAPPATPGRPASPAMAALAAARALGSKPGAAAKAAAPLSSNPPAPPAPPTPVTPTAPAEPVRRSAPEPVATLPHSADIALEESAAPDDMPPPWDDDILLNSRPAHSPVARERSEPTEPAARPAAVAQPPAAASTAEAGREVFNQPVAALNWDGDWPALAATLPVRGVTQQLAQQSELVRCEASEQGAQFVLRVPLATLLSAGSVEKLAAALGEHFGRNVRIETTSGAVEHTAHARAQALRAQRLQEAEQAILQDGFVQTLMRDFGAAVVTGSIRPL